jgi:hypothetical protein
MGLARHQRDWRASTATQPSRNGSPIGTPLSCLSLVARASMHAWQRMRVSRQARRVGTLACLETCQGPIDTALLLILNFSYRPPHITQTLMAHRINANQHARSSWRDGAAASRLPARPRCAPLDYVFCPHLAPLFAACWAYGACSSLRASSCSSTTLAGSYSVT